MGPRIALILAFASIALATVAAVIAGTWLVAQGMPGASDETTSFLIAYGGGTAGVLLALIAVCWAYLDIAVVRPLLALGEGIDTVLHANPEHEIEVDEHQLGGLPRAVNDLIRHLAIAKKNVDDNVRRATQTIEDEKNKLSTILRELHEGVIVCNTSHRILLYNKRSLEILHVSGTIGLDRSLFDLMSRQPILHAIERVNNYLASGRYASGSDRASVPFVGATIDSRFMLEGRLGLIIDADGAPAGYVLSFQDDTDELAALGLRDRLLRESTEGLRAPVANLRAAAEILSSAPELSPLEQTEFKKVLLKESKHLCDRLETLSSQYRAIVTSHWPTSDLYSANLFQTIRGRVKEQRGIDVVIVGIPQWLHGDSYSLVELLNRLVLRLRAHTGVPTFDLEAVAGEKHVYVDIIWQGAPIAASDLHGWLEDTVEEMLGGLTLRDVLDRHKTDAWSLTGVDSRARLRIPLPTAQHMTVVQEQRNLPPRPEFYDFDLLRRTPDLGDLGQRSLRSLNFVVFDTETTGLAPAAGDEVISLAGIRVVNGRILTGESFDRLVDPGRSIPPESIRFHGITDDDVKDKPPIQIVLPQFRRFVGDAVLVAHNAAFDLKFLKMREAESGTSFDMPVLDTLLLSAFLHDQAQKHSLDAVAQRFGIPIQGRHRALGDSLITAGIFLKMIELLEARGVTTLDQAIQAGQSVLKKRAWKPQF